MSTKTKIDWFKPVITKEMTDALVSAFENEKLVLGESVFKFEEEFAKYVGTDYAISTSSGTNALQFALEAAGCKGKKAVTSTLSFIASANAAVHAGGTPVLADVFEKSLTIDISTVKNDYDVIVPVHLYGNPCKMNELIDVSYKKNVPIIEDACQAHGAKWKGKKIGSLGLAGCFSFYTTKNMTVGGDGGMITTNDKKLADFVANIRNCGRTTQYEHNEVGYTSRLNTINAAVGRVQLKLIDSWNEEKAKRDEEYRALLKDVSQVRFLDVEKEATPAMHLETALVERRDELRKFLAEQGISTGLNYPIPIHLQPIYRKLYGYSENMYPKSETAVKKIVCLPLHPKLTTEEVRYVAEKIIEFFA